MLDADYEHYDIEVELTLFTPEEGGLKEGLPLTSHSLHIYLDSMELMARFTLRNREMLNPGETDRVFVTFFYKPHVLLGRLHPGKAFVLHEGFHPIGTGTILTMLNFEQHAEAAKQREEEENAQAEDPKRSRIPPSWERPRYRPRKKKKK